MHGMGHRQPGAVVAGAGLLLLGGWLIASGLGAPLAGLDRVWPLGLIVTGLAFLIQRSARDRQDNGLLFAGSVALLSGMLLCVFSFEIGDLTWGSMATYWPCFLLIGGTAFLLAHLAGDMRNQALLVPAYLLGGAGLAALPLTLGVIRIGTPGQLVRLAPVLAVLAAVAVILWLRARRNSASDDGEQVS